MTREIKTLSVPFEVKTVDELTGMVNGYASTFGNIDLDGDIIERGAFKKTITESGGNWPILANHDSSQQIGWNLEAEENAKGLKVSGELDIKNNPVALSKFSLARRASEIGAKMGLSIGFTIPKDKSDYNENTGIRRIKEVKLWEYSIVTFPANPKAGISGVKSAEADELLGKTKELIELTEALVLAGHRFTEAETKILSDYNELLGALREPSQEELNDTLGAAKELLATLQRMN